MKRILFLLFSLVVCCSAWSEEVDNSMSCPGVEDCTVMDSLHLDIVLDPVYVFENPDGTLFNSNETLMPGVTNNFNYHLDPSQYVSDEYAIMKVTGGYSFNYVLGLSATYRYKDNFSWKIFCDFDSARNKYRYQMDLFDDKTYDYMHSIASQFPEWSSRGDAAEKLHTIRERSHIDERFRSRLNFFTIGGAFSVNF